MDAIAKFIPLNPQEHENMLRTLIGKHMGGGGNPSSWVVEAMKEAYSAGFGLGFSTGMATASFKPAPPPAFKVQFAGPEPADVRPQFVPVPPEALPPGMRRIGRAKGDDVTDV